MFLEAMEEGKGWTTRARRNMGVALRARIFYKRVVDRTPESQPGMRSPQEWSLFFEVHPERIAPYIDCRWVGLRPGYHVDTHRVRPAARDPYRSIPNQGSTVLQCSYSLHWGA